MNENELIHTFRLEKGTDIPAMLEENLDVLEETVQLSPRDRFQLQLALDELVTNTASYGFASGRGSIIEIEVCSVPGVRYEVTISDDAPKFDPLSYDPEGKQSGTEETDFGGFGIPLVRKMMDSVSYSYTGERNVIRLRKKLSDQ